MLTAEGWGDVVAVVLLVLSSRGVAATLAIGDPKINPTRAVARVRGALTGGVGRCPKAFLPEPLGDGLSRRQCSSTGFGRLWRGVEVKVRA
jgi:hypothetical protein